MTSIGLVSQLDALCLQKVLSNPCDLSNRLKEEICFHLNSSKNLSFEDKANFSKEFSEFFEYTFFKNRAVEYLYPFLKDLVEANLLDRNSSLESNIYFSDKTYSLSGKHRGFISILFSQKILGAQNFELTFSFSFCPGEAPIVFLGICQRADYIFLKGSGRYWPTNPCKKYSEKEVLESQALLSSLLEELEF